ncbi:carbohydrate porin [Rhizosaccharibacter radicis]|uniref:Carbohydrate porin n=1 Tax=Rhizosaccharibacter radicis TaxID=2782605 RepID=A0ABT1VSS2_9PROT|nr:carbohydrate porin [Acetobacteraceae bacterium KSS12]
MSFTYANILPAGRASKLATGLFVLAALSGTSLGTARMAMAQTSLNPSVRVATPLPPAGVPINPVSSVPPLPTPEALFPGIFGVGSYLRDHGIAVLLDNVDEFSGIVKGDHKGSTNAGQYGLETDIDWERLAGLTGFSTHTVMVGRYGIPASRIFGDNLNPSQEIYGAGGNVAIHLVYAYGEETLANGRVDVIAGRIPVLNDFASNPLFCNFMNNAFCGNPKASSDNFAVSSYPDANWAFRVRVRPTRTTYIQSGIYFTEQNIYQAGNGYRSGFRFDSSQISGQTFPVQVGWEPSFGPDQLPGHYALGFIYDSNNHNDNYIDANGAPFVESGLPPKVRKGQTAEYAMADQMILRHGPGTTNGLIAFGALYHNDNNTSTRTSQASIALVDHGFWKARPQDGIVAGFSYMEVSDKVGKTEALQQELGLPITGTGGQFYNAAARGVQSHTYNFELGYQIHVYRGVTFAPDFQYFIRPNALANVGNAAVIGFKSHIELF